MHSDTLADPVESLTIWLGELELSIRVRHVGPDPAPVPAIEIVEPDQAWSAVNPTESHQWTLEEQALRHQRTCFCQSQPASPRCRRQPTGISIWW